VEGKPQLASEVDSNTSLAFAAQLKTVPDDIIMFCFSHLHHSYSVQSTEDYSNIVDKLVVFICL
jgi:hypothetical protein